MFAKTKQIRLSTSSPPATSEVWINADSVKLVEKKNVESLRNNGWRVPSSYDSLYAVFFIGEEEDWIYTDEDGFLNLTATKGK